MLIDFSDHLSVNVYALGAVYLQVRRAQTACLMLLEIGVSHYLLV